jgi:catechol 2,3-dioxygenase-like lactoylglutathione lyase family enzyme
MATFPAPAEGIALTHFVVASDVDRSRRFYADVLGGEVLKDGEPTIIALANSWIVINVGGPPTDDKPTVTLEPPRDPDRVSSFLNIRVADIHAVYQEWSGRGAQFLTPPTDRGAELRCYMRDPDGHLIEVGQRIPPARTACLKPCATARTAQFRGAQTISGTPAPLPPMTRSPRPGPVRPPCAVRRAGGGALAEAGAYGPFPASVRRLGRSYWTAWYSLRIPWLYAR